ncbi:28986_t:CDS:2, partial [Gigaspora margarita]
AGICKKRKINTYNMVIEDFNIVEKLSLNTNNAERKVQVDKNLGVLIQNSKIEDIDKATESDHSLVWSMLEIDKILSYSK